MLGLETPIFLLFVFCLLAVCTFEFVNGFHDTANAVATVIYTGSLKPRFAVIWSGCFNFLGVLAGGVSVAMGIVNLLPLGDIMAIGMAESISMVIALLLSAILWNLGTWYLGIPCSSSHTLIGSLLGVGIVFHYMHGGTGVNWGKAQDIGLSLLISPLFGFALSIILMFMGRQLIKSNKQIFKEPEEGSSPPNWIRAILITTCTLVSFFHGSNDGQKGVGLMLIVLMTFFPLQYALNENFNAEKTLESVVRIEHVLQKENKADVLPKLISLENSIMDFQHSADKENVFAIRNNINKSVKQISNELVLEGNFEFEDSKSILKNESKKLSGIVEFAPKWAIILISISLGLGTMIGWKRIVVTIGEKIGKRHLTYAEGATAELVAATTIGLSTGLGLPVSTTHVLSSGVAGAMTASKGVKNLQPGTIKSIAIAWILTLPVTILLAGGLFWLFQLLV
jgi:inorganic phosphate transporter, PiT family